MVFQPTSSTSERVKLRIPLPVDTHGQPVLDEKDRPIEGRTAVIMELPRYDYINRQLLKKIMREITDVGKRELTEEYEEIDRQYDVALMQFRPFVSDDVYALLEGLTIGEINQLAKQWTLQSETPLPEYSASYSSSKSTRRPSNPTSTSSTAAASTT